MNHRMLSALMVVTALCMASVQADVPSLMSYQGKLTDAAGVPVSDGNYTVYFRIYTAPSGGDLLWEEDQLVAVEDGLFSVLLGDVESIPDTVFTGPTRYLALLVRPDPEMSERKPIVSVGYAFHSLNADTAEYALSGAGGGGSNWTVIDSVLYTNNHWGIARGGAANVVIGDSGHTHVNLGVACTTGTSGQDYRYATVGGGRSNAAVGDYSTVGGGHDNHASRTATVGGGGDNAADEDYASVSGGEGNNASATWSAVGGGYYNFASEGCAAVGGGAQNTASGNWSVVSGGYGDVASASYATVGGGGNNTASSSAGTIAGGFHNSASGTYATVGGGEGDSAKAVYGGVCSGYSNLAGDAPEDTGVLVGGGYDNSATSKYATVCAGRENTASGNFATVGGGYFNEASGVCATAGGGWQSTASGVYATVGGGQHNIASFWAATIAGGYENSANGSYATVGGGYFNEASGTFAAVGGGHSDSTKAVFGGVCAGYSNLAGDAPEDTGVFVGGGYDNSAIAKYTTVCGGKGNEASELYAIVGGGYSNTASYSYTTVGGGSHNRAGDAYATAAGGYADTASGFGATVGGGYINTASGDYSTVGGGLENSASGWAATVPGGFDCEADGNQSFAVGSGSVVPSSYNNSAAFSGQTATASGQTRVATLSKTGGTFTIDHPTDPTNKILNHYFVESPEMVLIYRGVAIIGSNGRTEVHLPDYFEALNRTPMVQLTGVGTSDVFVSEKVSGNRFVIGGKAGTEVYWTVTGDRKDQSAEITRMLMPVEQSKEGELAGHSLDDDFLATTKVQLERMGRADEFEFRTSAGQEKYEQSLRVLESNR